MESVRAIDVVPFVSERISSLSSFQSALSFVKKYGIQKHMRRRTCSYRTYRFPLRLAMNPKDDKRAFQARCRKHRRRGKYMLSKANRLAKPWKWLETHIWNAKRMMMDEKYGFKLAIKRNDWGERAVYRAVSTASTMYDASYFSKIMINGSITNIIDVLNDLITPFDVSSSTGELIMFNADTIQFDRQYFVSLHEYSFECPSPCGPSGVIFRKVKEGLSQVLMTSHPTVEVKRLVSQSIERLELSDCVNIMDLSDDLAIIEMRGVMANSVMHKALCAENFNERFASGGSEEWRVLDDSQLPNFPRVWPVTLRDPKFNTPFDANKTILTFDKDSSFSPLWSSVSREQIIKDSGATMPSGDEKRTDKVEPNLHSVPVFICRRTSALGGGMGFGSGFDLIIPSGWVMDFWMKLQLAGGRAIALDGRQYIIREQGLNSFPEDWPQTFVGNQHLSCERLSEEVRFKSQRKRHRIIRASKYQFGVDWEDFVGLNHKSDDDDEENSNNNNNNSTNKLEDMDISFESNDDMNMNEDILEPHLMVVEGRPFVLQTRFPEFCQSAPSTLLLSVLITMRDGVLDDGSMICAPLESDLPLWLPNNNNNNNNNSNNSDKSSLTVLPKSKLPKPSEVEGYYDFLNPKRKIIGHVLRGFRSNLRGNCIGNGFVKAALLNELNGFHQKLQRRRRRNIKASCNVINTQYKVLVRRTTSPYYTPALMSLKFNDIDQ